MLTTLVAFLGMLVVLILAHELGHFLAAKAFRVKVEEFGLGYPPRLFSFKHGETTYSLNAIPLGGFTKMLGEEDPHQPRSLARQGVFARLVILGAGSLMNVLLPVALFSLAFMLPHQTVTQEISVVTVTPNSPAAIGGIQPGDIIREINGRAVTNINDLDKYIKLNLGRPAQVTVTHSDGTPAEVTVTPRWRPPAGQGPTGITLTGSTPSFARRSYPLWEAVPRGLRETWETLNLYKNEIIRMVIGVSPVTITGPVGVAQLTGEVVRAGINPLLQFAAFLSLNLAVVNLFPLPALDGGRMAFVLLEWLRGGKRVSPRVEGLIHLIGFVLLITLMLVITYQDIVRIIAGEGPLP